MESLPNKKGQTVTIKLVTTEPKKKKNRREAEQIAHQDEAEA